MEKKIKFSENPTAQKTLYGAIIGLLCLAAIIIGIVAASGSSNDVILDPDDSEVNGGIEDGGNENEGEGEGEAPAPENERLSFIAPAAGTVMKGHSTDIPVFSETLEAWRVHTGIDIATEEGAPVFAAEEGEVTRIYNDPMLGATVEISHRDGMVTRYSNLNAETSLTVGLTVEKGAEIGKVGDSAISELADEPHLHFEMLSEGVKVDPLAYIGEEAQKSSLGISGD